MAIFDLALDVGTTDEVYLSALSDALDQITATFEADLVFYLAGADPYKGDRLGRLSLTKTGLAKRDQKVINTFRNLGIPVAIAMAGGYAPDHNDIVDIHYQTIASAVKRLVADETQPSSAKAK